MGSERTAWHVYFAALIVERAPPEFEILVELVLTLEPQKADLLLIRRTSPERHEALTLRRLWPELTRETLVEFKSVSKPPRPGDWIRLLGYGAQHHAQSTSRIRKASDLTLVFVVPSLTPTVRDEASSLGWSLEDLKGGYYRVRDSEYPGLLLVLQEIAEAERDDLLRWFARATLPNRESLRWIMSHTTADNRAGQPQLRDLEGYEDIVRSFLSSLTPQERLAGLAPEERLAGLAPQERLAGLAPEERLAGLAPQERVAGLTPEQRVADLPPERTVLALSNDLLRRLPDEWLKTLPEAIQAEIRRRLA